MGGKLGRWTKREDRGFVAVLFAVSVIAFLGIAGLSVDIGNWYLHIERTQRAADSAALAGAVYLPGDTDSAVADATDALGQNASSTGSPTYMGPDPNNPAVMKVTLRNTVPNVFAALLGNKTFTYERTAKAAYRTGLGLGSPFNVLGADPTNSGWQNGVGPPMEYYLSSAGKNHEKGSTDRWDSGVCGGYEDNCSGSTNLERDATPREYIVNVAAGTTGWLEIDGLDLTDNTSTTDTEADSYSTPGPVLPLNIWVYSPKASKLTDAPISTAQCKPMTVAPDDANYSMKWAPICIVQIDGTTMPTGQYVVRIQADQTVSSVAMNGYSLRAGIIKGSTFGSPLDVDLTKGIQVYAKKHLVTHHDPAAILNYYLTELPSNWAGSTLGIELWDFGELGVSSEQITWADTGIEPTGCTLVIKSAGLSIPASNGKCTFATSGIYGNFQGRVQEISVPIDPTYTCVKNQPTSCWLSLRAPTGSASAEGSSVSLGSDGLPVRLLPNK